MRKHDSIEFNQIHDYAWTVVQKFENPFDIHETTIMFGNEKLAVLTEFTELVVNRYKSNLEDMINWLANNSDYNYIIGKSNHSLRTQIDVAASIDNLIDTIKDCEEDGLYLLERLTDTFYWSITDSDHQPVQKFEHTEKCLDAIRNNIIRYINEQSSDYDNDEAFWCARLFSECEYEDCLVWEYPEQVKNAVTIARLWAKHMKQR